MADWTSQKDRLLKGDALVTIYIKNERNPRVGVACLDLAFQTLFMSHSRYLDTSTLGWTAEKLPWSKVDKKMEVGLKTDYLVRWAEVHEVYFMNDDPWRAWLEKP